MKNQGRKRHSWLGLVTLVQVGVLVFIVGVGCSGGGGGDGGSPTQPSSPTTSSGISFQADQTAESNSIYLDEGDAPDDDTLVVEIRVMDVTDLYGLSFDLMFPDDILSFKPRATEEGPWLNKKGKVDTSFEIREKPGGNLVVGYTRLGDVPGRTGSGLVLSLEFNAESSGSGDLTFSLTDAVSSKGESMSDVMWISSSITVSL